MILTVTLNAALDVTYPVDRLVPGAVHRVGPPRRRAGGKGVNVARVLAALGEEVLATGFAGGATGAAFLADLPVPSAFVQIGGETRCTLTVLDAEATLFNEPGPLVTEPEWQAFLTRFRTLRADVVVLSGSLPPGLPDDAYARLIEAADAPVILDADGPALLHGLPARPALVKPNAQELRATGRTPAQLRALGAQAVAVSDGPRGLAVHLADGGWRATPPETHGNPTGAGDAAVAAFARGLRRGTPWPELVADAVALSAAAVAAPVAGDFDADRYTAAEIRPTPLPKEHE
ncbi:tagatose 6-phosphate kinase [Actinocorallia herbida]|uniref:Tagatose 6-phosphate kinase n=1 Tax=Actinocorallia herbida TaxID=58109 RepID=A0A3N1D0E2_9ACTN|nr:1-phosphofructokinase family hexose kinase [Actinocorallia herbida]ROO86984.1 tagatose 6-phosphate kinase [Actinocorallia herbida]